MEHQSFEQLHRNANLIKHPLLYATRDERLYRWADLLDQEPNRRLVTLHRLEFVSRSERPNLRSDDSPIEVAFTDPLLRASGLTGDSYGEARAFFGLSERQAHRLLCSCINGYAVEARRVAINLRKMTSQQSRWESLIRICRSRLSSLRPNSRIVD